MHTRDDRDGKQQNYITYARAPVTGGGFERETEKRRVRLRNGRTQLRQSRGQDRAGPRRKYEKHARERVHKTPTDRTDEST